MKRVLSYLCWAVMILALALHLFNLVFGLIFHGSALDGYVEDGRYFLGSHGIMHEVSAPIWHISNFLGHTFMFTFPTAVLFAFLSALLSPQKPKDGETREDADK